MIRDLPYLIGAHWRHPSWLTKDEQESWEATLNDLDHRAVVLVNFRCANPGGSWDGRTTQPIMKVGGGWRSLGAGRKFDSSEIPRLDEVESLEIIRT